jgi:hypothetical protein
MYEALHTRCSGMLRHSRGGFDMHGTERLIAALHIQAHRINDAEGASEGDHHRSIITDIRPDELQCR